MSDNGETTAVVEYDYSTFDASSGYSLEQWGLMADLAAMGRRLKKTLPGGDKLQPWEAIGVAQYAQMQGANPWRGEIYGYSDKHGFHLVEGYKLLVRWAKAKCDYAEWFDPMPEDKLPGPGDIGYTVHILRDDKQHLLDTLLKHGMEVDRVMDIVTTSASGVVRKQEQSDYPPSGWTWHDVAKKRALKNGLNKSHGAPSAAEIARESWVVNGVETKPEDWGGAADRPAQDRELEAEYKARARERKEKRDDSLEAGRAVTDLFGDDAGNEYIEGITEEAPQEVVEPETADRGPDWGTDPVETPTPATDYIRVPYPDGLSGQELLTHAVTVMPFKHAGQCMTVLAQVHGPEWRKQSPAAQWETLDAHCASATVQAEMPLADEVPA